MGCVGVASAAALPNLPDTKSSRQDVVIMLTQTLAPDDIISLRWQRSYLDILVSSL